MVHFRPLTGLFLVYIFSNLNNVRIILTAAPSSKPGTEWGFCPGENRALPCRQKRQTTTKNEVFNDNCFTATIAIQPMHG
jgi:hypothetical protein